MLCVCCLCHQITTPEQRLCLSCVAALEKSRTPALALTDDVAGQTADGLVALYFYGAEVRKLILRAKIRNDLPCWLLLQEIFRRDPRAQALGRWADMIVPAPSSLWGRLRGRFDISFALSHSLAKQAGRCLKKPPPSLYWRLRKRARLKQRAALPLVFGQGAEANADRVLLVDDIITTGFTLSQVAAGFPGAQIRFLTLADAR